MEFDGTPLLLNSISVKIESNDSECKYTLLKM